MKELVIESTNITPLVDFNCLSGDLVLSGKYLPENSAELFEPVLRWLNEYIQAPRQITNFRINLEHFNAATSKLLARIVKPLSCMSDPENLLMIHLYFSVEEFDNLETEDVRDALTPVIDVISNAAISIGVKIYGTDEKGEVIKESMVLI